MSTRLRPAARPRRRLLVLGLVVLLAAPGVGALAATVPPPTPVPVPGGGTSPSPFPTALVTPSPSDRPPEMRAPSAVLTDLDTGQVLFERDGGSRRPIASLTKIMTALLVLRRSNPGEVVTIGEDAAVPTQTVGISQLGLREGERVTVEQLLYALLVQSANDAAVALADQVSGSVEAFVSAMNARARHLGLRDTRFASPNGLDDTGYSSALDLARLTRVAYRQPLFAQAVASKFHDVPGPEDGQARHLQNRNALLWLYPGAIGVKTGFTTAAGYCLVAAAQRDDLRLLAVVLGERGEPFSDAAALLDYGFAAFEHRTLVTDGEDLGSVTIDGRSVRVAAGGDLRALVPVDARVQRTIRVLADVGFPPGRGERIGAVRVDSDGLRLGRVPLVVTQVPPPPAPDPGPWWRRAATSVAQAVTSLLSALYG